MRYKAILFDVSDTLIAYRPDYAQIYGGRLRNIGLKVTEEKGAELAQVINMTINTEILKEQNGGRHLKDEELEERLDEAALLYVCNDKKDYKRLLEKLRKLPVPKQELYIKDDVISVLEYLKLKYRLGIVSNHKVWLMEYLKECGLAAYFETIVISDLVGISKPDPGIMLLAIDALDLDSQDCLYVGDQPFDILCSKKAGMDCAWITSEKSESPNIGYQEDYRIREISELKRIL